MPCDSIVLNQIHLGLANKELLAAALKDLGATEISQSGQGEMRFRLGDQAHAIRNGELIGPGNVGATADRIKQAYSAQVVTRAASRFGWTTKKTAANKLKVSKRN
jgi:hypothetical protein